MKTFRPFFTTALAFGLAVFSTAVQAETFQITDDAAGATKTNTIAKAAGLATTLPVSSKSTAFLRFKVTDSNIVSSAVTEARLVIYLSKITKPGNLTVNVNATGFTELFPTKTIPSPTVSSTVTTIPVVAEDTKSFITIIVTNQVKAWLDGAPPEFGFSITSDGTASVLISSKEGSGSGYPAVLEVDAAGAGGAVAGSDGIFSGTLSAGSLGIGTTTPGFPIDVEGTGDLIVNLNQTGSGGVGVIQTNSSRSYFAGIFGGSNRWSIYDATGSNFQERLTVASNGRVGIGTGTPGYHLEIASTGDTQIALTSTSANGRTYSFQSSNGGSNLGDGSFQIIDRTAGAARLFIAKDGNTGIGVTTGSPPTAKLDVRGDIKLGASGQFFAVGGQENLRTLRGIVSVVSTPAVVRGAGFSVARFPGVVTGNFVVSFTTPFTDIPSVTCNAYTGDGTPRIVSLIDVTANSFTIYIQTTAGALIDNSFSFIAVGPR